MRKKLKKREVYLKKREVYKYTIVIRARYKSKRQGHNFKKHFELHVITQRPITNKDVSKIVKGWKESFAEEYGDILFEYVDFDIGVVKEDVKTRPRRKEKHRK